MSRLTLALLLAVPLLALAQPKAKPDDAEPNDGKRVAFAFDPGSHTRPISALGFNKDQSKLITVGWDYSIQVWSPKTGERLDILHLPPYGRDNGLDPNRWDRAAVSHDGDYVAVGGGPKVFGDEKEKTQLVLVDVANRRVRRVPLGADEVVTALHFSADGTRLAVGTKTAVHLLDDVKAAVAARIDVKALTPKRLPVAFASEVIKLALSPAGEKLVVAEEGKRLSVWAVAGKAPEKWAKTGEDEKAGRTHAVAWAPDGSHFARNVQYGNAEVRNGIELVGPDGKAIKGWDFKDLRPAVGAVGGASATLRYLAPDRLFVSHYGQTAAGTFTAMGIVLDQTTGKAVRRFTESAKTDLGNFKPYGAAADKGDLAATTTLLGMEVVIYRLSDGEVVARCGCRTPPPTMVGWASDPKAPVVAWADDPNLRPFNSKATDLTAAFDLTTLEPVSRLAPSAFDLRRLQLGEWGLEYTGGMVAFVGTRVVKGGKPLGKLTDGNLESVTLIPNGSGPPRIAYGQRDFVTNMGTSAALLDADRKPLAAWLPMATSYRDMVSSPDGRYVLACTGTNRLVIYRTDGSRFPFLQLVRANGEWVCWTAEGYYAASPGGEKLIGWAVSNGPNELATFHPADKFAKHFRRPDLIKLAIEKGSVKEALAALKTASPDVETILPPEATLTLVKQAGATVLVRAEARGMSKGKPVLAMRVLLDGKPLADGKGVWDPAGKQPAAGEFAFDVPAGLHELKVLARTEDGASVSAVVLVRGPKGGSPQPSLHRLCIGIDEYDDPGLKLGSAVKDAEGLFAALEKHCVGPDNRFGAATGELLVNKNATREKALQALAGIRKKAKPGDLVVVFFAGHGIKQKDEFYLVTREGDPAKSLGGASLSGADLKKELGKMECPVLLILDACHSAAAVKSFRPATDDLTRTMTDDSVGVTVLSAAMSHETAGATAENGHFTAGLLKGLAAGTGVPFDPYEKQMYIHHVYSVAFGEVRRATGGKQNPFLNMPWTMSPLVVREVPVR